MVSITTDTDTIRLLSPKKGGGAFMGAPGRWHIVTTVEKQYKGHHQRKRQREGFFSKSASAKPRNVR